MNDLVRFFRILLLVVILGVPVVLVPLKITDDKGLGRIRRLKAELQTLQDGNRELQRQNASFSTQIRTFHADPRYVEKIARDELGMVGPNERIYQFPSDERETTAPK